MSDPRALRAQFLEPLEQVSAPGREHRRVLGSRCVVAIVHPSRRGPDGTLEGHLDGGAPAVLPGLDALDGDPDSAPLHVSVVMDGPMRFVSRRVAALHKELFGRRFPAIERGEVDVYAVAREPGVRAKVASTATGWTLTSSSASLATGWRSSRSSWTRVIRSST